MEGEKNDIPVEVAMVYSYLSYNEIFTRTLIILIPTKVDTLIWFRRVDAYT
jgi:hypothetical protein